jgi:hypothetical protein
LTNRPIKIYNALFLRMIKLGKDWILVPSRRRCGALITLIARTLLAVRRSRSSYSLGRRPT